ncbi:hypothetical protein Tc00.1047053510039.36 [Trypanosoma cruzi]|uniref:Uncharacterized protein n=1 Tax=Trypanosoma cruzi (strain CL Brener) TaxID=353153 RepID=Q4D9K9_TRYCC|nr:hypothetical protein Tc00.1047053510039.36 [Trypanosoma cruzi]EAN89213.1 hypothetical protein Tc00.1047053510039.36 [Trypanosoma cruzi]|eukprot:XP_811064.1 hypothetical protein [Trypanosoma cruzi strain CL Brener]
MATIKARHKSHCDRTSSCDERRCVHGSAAHTCWQAACSRCPRASSSAPSRKRENGLFPMHLFPPAAPTRWSPAVIPHHIQECRKVPWSCQPAMPQSPHTCRLHQRRHTNHKQHPSHVFRTSLRHTATRQTEVFVTPRTSPHNQIVHAPRTAAAHTRQTSALRSSVVHVLQWEVNKRDRLPNPKECHDWPQVDGALPLKTIQSSCPQPPTFSHNSPKSCKSNAQRPFPSSSRQRSASPAAHTTTIPLIVPTVRSASSAPHSTAPPSHGDILPPTK